MKYPEIKYDVYGNRLYYKQDEPELWEGWMKYFRDERGNCTYYEDSNGTKKWMKYTDDNKLKSFESSNGYWEEYKYDNNKLIGYSNSLGMIFCYV